MHSAVPVGFQHLAKLIKMSDISSFFQENQNDRKSILILSHIFNS